MKYLLIFSALLTQALIAADYSLLYRCTGDIFFVMDSSTSIWIEDFNQQLKFVKDLVDTFQIGKNESEVRVGVITFNDIAHLEFSFDRYTTRDEVKEAISKIKYHTGDTNTADALHLLQKELTPHIGNTNRTLIAVVITDGQSLDSRATKEEALKLHKLGIKMHVIGVGSRYDMKELRLIASSTQNIHEVTNYAALNDIAKFFRDRLCIEETTTQPLTTTPIPTTSAATTTTTVTFTMLQRLVASPMTTTIPLSAKSSNEMDNYAPASHAQISYASVNSVENNESKVNHSPGFTKPVPAPTDKESHSKNLNMAQNGNEKSLAPASKNFDQISPLAHIFQLSDAVMKGANSLAKTDRKEASELVHESPTIFPLLHFQQMKSYQNANEKEITTKKVINLTNNKFDNESAIDVDIETHVDSDSDSERESVENERALETTKDSTKAKKKVVKSKKNKKSKSKKKRPNKKNKSMPKNLPTTSSEVDPGKKNVSRIDETDEVEYVVEPTETPKKDKKTTPKKVDTPSTGKPKYVTEKKHKEYDENANSDTVIFGFDYLNLGTYRTKMIFKFIDALLPDKTTGSFGIVTNSYLPKDYSIPLSPFTKRKNYDFSKEITIIKPSGTTGVIKRIGDILYKKGVEERSSHFKRLIGVIFIDPSVTNINPDMLIEANAFKDSGFELYLVSVGKRRWRNVRALVSLSSQPHSRYLINIPTYQYLVDNVSNNSLLPKVFAIYKRKP